MRSVPGWTPVRSASCPIVSSSFKTSTDCIGIFATHVFSTFTRNRSHDRPRITQGFTRATPSTPARILQRHTGCSATRPPPRTWCRTSSSRSGAIPQLFDPAARQPRRLRGDDGAQPRRGPRALAHRGARRPSKRLGVRDEDAGREAEDESPAQSVVRRDEAGRVLAAWPDCPRRSATPCCWPSAGVSRQRRSRRRPACRSAPPRAGCGSASRRPARRRALRARRRGGGLTGGRARGPATGWMRCGDLSLLTLHVRAAGGSGSRGRVLRRQLDAPPHAPRAGDRTVAARAHS